MFFEKLAKHKRILLVWIKYTCICVNLDNITYYYIVAIPEPQVKEVLLVAVGHNASRPLLLLRLENEVLLYEAYSYPRVSLNMKFSKVANLLVKDANAEYDLFFRLLFSLVMYSYFHFVKETLHVHCIT